MARASLRLYRGLSATEFSLLTPRVFKDNRQAWAKILKARVKGDFRYPRDLDPVIRALHKNIRLENQHFTDSRAIAEGYARQVGGVLVILTVPIKDVLKHFDIEFQNFGCRKDRFELVYRVNGLTLARKARCWRLSMVRKQR